MTTITLTTDFGLNDPYVGSMKGVILSIAQSAVIVDISHSLDFADVRQASFILEASHKYFPPGTIHVIVVDPGVGGSRRAVAARTEPGVFLAPDNGCLTRILYLYPNAEIRSIENRALMLKNISNTFHGRDIFAPAAAHLADGVDFSRLGPVINDPVRYEIERCAVKKDSITAHVIHIDAFGNMVTDIPLDYQDIQHRGELKLTFTGDYTVIPADTYESLPEERLGIVPGSSGYYEIVINRGSAASRLAAGMGDELVLTLIGGDL